MAASDPSTTEPVGQAHSWPHDFGFLVGSWTVQHQRLGHPLSGRLDWSGFIGAATSQTLMGGAASIDEMALSDGETGMSIRLYSPATEQWTIFWVNSRDGRLQPPVSGSFSDGQFEAHGDDEHDGRPIRARYRWSEITDHTARWEQAFSTDGGETWETNWVMDWQRTPADSPA